MICVFPLCHTDNNNFVDPIPCEVVNLIKKNNLDKSLNRKNFTLELNSVHFYFLYDVLSHLSFVSSVQVAQRDKDGNMIFLEYDEGSCAKDATSDEP